MESNLLLIPGTGIRGTCASIKWLRINRSASQQICNVTNPSHVLNVIGTCGIINYYVTRSITQNDWRTVRAQTVSHSSIIVEQSAFNYDGLLNNFVSSWADWIQPTNLQKRENSFPLIAFRNSRTQHANQSSVQSVRHDNKSIACAIGWYDSVELGLYKSTASKRTAQTENGP